MTEESILMEALRSAANGIWMEKNYSTTPQ